MHLPIFLRGFLPDRTLPVRIWRGPFRGARICMNPHRNLRKILGLYEHELNDWLVQVLPKVVNVLDVGANDGYFTFGCVAAFRRGRQAARILAFEPEVGHCRQLEASRDAQSTENVEVTIHQTLVGRESGDHMRTLDDFWETLAPSPSAPPGPTLIKIDVEGAEVDVIAGASRWLRPENYFLIEVHAREFLALLREKFAAAGIVLEQRDQRALPVLGREERPADIWWLVSRLP